MRENLSPSTYYYPPSFIKNFDEVAGNFLVSLKNDHVTRKRDWKASLLTTQQTLNAQTRDDEKQIFLVAEKSWSYQVGISFFSAWNIFLGYLCAINFHGISFEETDVNFKTKKKI